MKKYRFLTAAVLLASVAVTVSCNREGDSNLPPGRTEVKFSSNIITMGTHTKASGTNWDPLDAIGVYMYEENDVNVVESKSNVKYVTESGGTTGSFEAAGTVIYFPDNGDKVRFMAYYPYSTPLADDVYQVNVTDQSSQLLIDLLYSFDEGAKYDKTTQDKKVPLVFDHQLTKIYVNVKAGTGLTSDDLQNIGVAFLGLNTEADFNLVNGELSNSDVPAEIAARSLAAKEGYVASFEAIVIPTDGTPDAQINFDLSNGDTDTGVESDVYTWDFDNTLDKSTKYTYNVTVSRSGIVVEATINDWIVAEDNDIIAE